MDECQTGTLEKGEELVVCVSYSFWQHEIEKIETGKKNQNRRRIRQREREKERKREIGKRIKQQIKFKGKETKKRVDN